MLNLLRRRERAQSVEARLYGEAVARSRDPRLYAQMGAPDTAEGRFELLTVHLLLVIQRLNDEGKEGRAIGQALFDLYIRNLDSALREMGVGDLAVAKRMKGLGRIFYGRATAYAAAFAAGDAGDLEALVARTIFVDQPEKSARALADHLSNERKQLNEIDHARFLSGDYS